MMSALIASGGGSRCSHSAGAAHYIANHERDRYPGFQIMSGVSGGALNVAGWAQYAPSSFREATEFVLRVWTEQIKGNRSIYRYKVPVPGFRWMPSIFRDSIADGAPLEKLLRELMDVDRLSSSGVKVRWPALNLRTAALHVFDENAEDPVLAVMASSSFPSVFPLVRIGDDFYSDGGIVDRTPIKGVVAQGADKVCVLTTKVNGIKNNRFPQHVFRRLHLEFSAQIDQALFNDVRKCCRVNLELQSGQRDPSRYRHIEVDFLPPSRELEDSLSFDPDTVLRQIDLGYEDAYRYFAKRRIGLI